MPHFDYPKIPGEIISTIMDAAADYHRACGTLPNVVEVGDEEARELAVYMNLASQSDRFSIDNVQGTSVGGLTVHRTHKPWGVNVRYLAVDADDYDPQAEAERRRDRADDAAAAREDAK